MIGSDADFGSQSAVSGALRLHLAAVETHGPVNGRRVARWSTALHVPVMCGVNARPATAGHALLAMLTAMRQT